MHDRAHFLGQAHSNNWVLFYNLNKKRPWLQGLLILNTSDPSNIKTFFVSPIHEIWREIEFGDQGV